MNKYWYPSVALLIAGLIYYFTTPNRQQTPVTPPTTPESTVKSAPAPTDSAFTPSLSADRPSDVDEGTISSAPLKKGDRAIYGELPDGMTPQKLVMANTPKSDWPKFLRKNLVQSGGKQLKKIELEPQESYIIMEGAEGRYVERVIVSVTAHDGRQTRFFAEVDSETGYVMKSWGATIHERRHQH